MVITRYLDAAMGTAEYRREEDDTYSGAIPEFLGVTAHEVTLASCRDKLLNQLEKAIILGLWLNQTDLPTYGKISLVPRTRRRSTARKALA
jgi:predicted RNase H-like HicB family nuclease